VAAVSDLGRIRPNNEDSLLIFEVSQKAALQPGQEIQLALAPPGVLLAVADGMGGHSSGQVASQLCVEKLPGELLKTFSESTSPPTDLSGALKQAVETTNQVVHSTAQQVSAYRGMGTTLTAAWVASEQAVIAQVGDSRAYLFHQHRLAQLTRDQTYLSSLSEAEREALSNTPYENMLLQALGATAQLEVVVTTAELAAGDSLLLCSDGLYRVVSPQQMAEILQEPEAPQKKTEKLIRLANGAGGPDNVTVVLCEFVRP
jgi:serine/threonine protein phosphatase PrpC